KELEEQKLEVIKAANEKEKEEANKKFEQLLSDENIQAEARKLIIEKNNEEILKLLQKYNPNWQNSGQSLSESLLNGINSEKQSVQDAIKEAVNLKEIIPEQEKELERLKLKLEEIEKLKSNTSESSSNASLESESAGSGDLGASIEDVNSYADGIEKVDENIKKLDLSTNRLAKETVPKANNSTKN
ncbi:hypothetical protein BM530_07475, partial [Clostridioides difficile]